jgi:hypothetical protein
VTDDRSFRSAEGRLGDGDPDFNPLDRKHNNNNKKLAELQKYYYQVQKMAPGRPDGNVRIPTGPGIEDKFGSSGK